LYKDYVERCTCIPVELYQFYFNLEAITDILLQVEIVLETELDSDINVVYFSGGGLYCSVNSNSTFNANAI
jgi:hypothetical protein